MRESAYNRMGYSLVSLSTPRSQKPMVPPGPPTGVTLQVISGKAIRIFLNPPQDDGGDTVGAYEIQWSKNSTFDVYESHTLTTLSGGAPFIYTAQGLDMGESYYFRTAGINAMGRGSWQSSSPTFEHPRREPTAPTNVRLGITSASMLTVSFDTPTDIGGDPITFFKIEWDRLPNFQGKFSLPHKGEAQVDASKHRSYTISPPTGLQENTVYYVRVSARNVVGYGVQQLPVPAFAAPVGQVPGKVSGLVVKSQQGAPGNLTVSWNAPIVPDHQIFCGGGGPGSNVSGSPDACPVGMGRDTEADGGRPILYYQVHYDVSEFMNSTGTLQETGNALITNLAGGEPFHYTIPNLDVTKKYYVSVLAHNDVGNSRICKNTGVLCDGEKASAAPDGA